jgi:transcription termination/antitermination protein NusG
MVHITAVACNGSTFSVRDLLMTQSWYVAALQPGREDVAERHLARQEFRSFLPRQIRRVRHARRSIDKPVAFFPGYLFVCLDLQSQRWRAVNGTFGVRSLIMAGDQPAACPHGLVEALMAMSGDDGLVRPAPLLEQGSLVRVVAGPFAELVGRLDRLDGARRAHILISLLQGEVRVSIATRDLTPAAA